jgi:outer membrane protein insertion porin family
MPVRRGLAAACLAVVLGVAATARADVTDYLGRTVTTVSVQAEGRALTDARLMALIATPTGHPLDMRDVRESITHLFSLAQYEDVRVHASLAGDGVVLVYELMPIHPVTSIQFAGGDVPGIDEGRLRQLLIDRFGATPRASRAPEMAIAVEQALHDAGYLRARLTPRADIAHAPEHTTLTFDIDAGPRARLGTITVAGDAGMTAAELLAQLDVGTGQAYDQSRLNSRIDRYVENRRRNGYYEARLSMTPLIADESRTVNLTLNAQQGPLVRVVFAGDPVPGDRRDELVPVAREGSADEDLLEDSTNRIEDFYRSQGYRDVSAPFTREQKGGELIVTFTVHRGPLYRVESIDIVGSESLSSGDLSSRLRVRPGQPFSAAALDADLTQIEEAYRRLGFAAAKADATPNLRPASGDQHIPVAIRIEVTENTQTLVNSVHVEGNEQVPDADLNAVLGLAPGQPFSLAKLALDRDAIELAYANLGFQSATVDTRPGLSADGRQADVVFVVREGPRIYVDHVLIVGNERTKTATVERELRFKAGDPLGLEAISESQRRLAALGLFRRARITQLGHGDETQRDVLVSLEEAPLTTIGYGGGVEVRRRITPLPEDPTIASEKIEFGPRASFEVGRRNLFGTNRSVNLFTSLSLHPSDTLPANSQGQATDTGRFGLPEYRVVGQFRQPRIRGSNADFRVTGTLEQQIRSSFDFTRRGVSAELAVRLPRNMSASGGYQLQRTRVFNETIETSQLPEIDRLFPKVRLSSFLGSIIRDTRDDPVDPERGRYFSANGQVAARVIGSEVGFLKSFFTAQMFRTLPGRRAIVFAASARVGAAVALATSTGERDLPASERFFAGGDTTVRGFALDRLGTQHVPPVESDTLDPGGYPLGGNGLLLFNGELRVPVGRGVKVVGFADVGNVYRGVSDVSLRELRPALGTGFRYKSPVGPLRFDLGFKVPRRRDEPRTEWFITFGEAF